MPILIGHEELAFISRMAGKANLRGLPLQLGDDQASVLARLSAAENSLQAKGWYRRDGLTLSIENTVLNAVGFLITAPVVLGIRRTVRNMPTASHLFYLSPDLRLHVDVETGFYRIDAYEPETFDEAIQAVFGQTPRAEVERYPLEDIPTQAFIGLTALAQIQGQDKAEALKVLTSQNMYFEQADLLFDIYRHTWQATVNLSAWMGEGGANGAPSSTLTLLDTSDGWWQVMQTDNATVALHPLTNAQVSGLLDNVLNHVFIAAN